jgi:hypothetical protein
MNGKASDIVWMGLKCGNLFVGVVVENTQLEVVGTSHEPVLASNKFDTTNRDLRDLKSLDQSACFVVVDVDTPIV